MIAFLPDLIICRADRVISEDDRQKISLFCNVRQDAVISLYDVDLIYRIPRILFEQGVDELICGFLNLSLPEADLSIWDGLLNKFGNTSYSTYDFYNIFREKSSLIHAKRQQKISHKYNFQKRDIFYKSLINFDTEVYNQIFNTEKKQIDSNKRQ